MADVTIDGSAEGRNEFPLWGGTAFAKVAVSDTVVYQFYSKDSALGASADDLVYKKSTDGEATWGSEVLVNATAIPFCVWFDKWTSGDSGGLIHIAYRDDNAETFNYRNLNTSTDSLSGETEIASGVGGSDEVDAVYIAKARGGNIYAGLRNATVNLFYRSTDGGSTWTSRTGAVEAQEDAPFGVLLPANLADANDMWLVYGDRSANALTVKTYDDSGNSWSETAIGSPPTIVFGTAGLRQVAASVRHSDGHAIIALNTHVDNAAADLMVFDWDGSSFSTLTNIITNADDWATVGVCIDQNTDDIYVAWLGNPDGSQTWGATVNPYYAVSTDGGTTWGASTRYDEGTADDYRSLWLSPSTPGQNDGLFSLSWFDDDDNDIWTNAVNAVVLAAGGGVVQVPVAGNQPAGGGTVATTRAEVVAGSQPPATGELDMNAQIATEGDQDAPSGEVQTFQTDDVAGSQAPPSGTIGAVRSAVVGGNQPPPIGVVNLSAMIATAGSQDAPSGVINDKTFFIALGDQPAGSGALNFSVTKDVAGSQDAPSGVVSPVVMRVVAISGSQDPATGQVRFTAFIAVDGNQPAGSGVVAGVYKVSIAGNQPASSGELAKTYRIDIRGAQDAPSGVLALAAAIAVSGVQGAPSGTVAAFLGIVVLGDQDAPSGTVTALVRKLPHGTDLIEIAMADDLDDIAFIELDIARDEGAPQLITLEIERLGEDDF